VVMSVVPTFWFGSRVRDCFAVSAARNGADALENSMPSRARCLSERDKELPDRDSSSLSINLRP